MKNKILFLIHIAFTLIFIFPLRINPDSERTGKTYTSNYCTCKSKPDYYVEVSLREIYVTVKDKDGRHIKDLKPSEFKLWEDGIEQKIVAVDKVDLKETKKTNTGIEEKKTIETKPMRYFALVIGNVPDLDVQKEKSKEAIKNFINNNIGPSDNISLYVMNQSSLELIVPFNLIPKDSKSAALKYLEGENFGGKGFTSTRRGSLYRSMTLDDENYDDRYIRNMEFMNTAKFLESLCRGMQYINGKKDIILFSEGFFFDPDFSRDLMQKPDSERAEDMSRFAQAKMGPSSATLIARLMDLKKAFVQYDLALQVIDLGTSTNSLVDVSEKHIAAAAAQNSPTDYERKRTQMLQTISDSSGGSYYAYSNTTNKLNRDLENVDYSTSFYYVVSYSSSEQNDPDDYLPIKIDVSRDNAVLEYKKGIVVPENFENLNENEQNAQLNFISQSSMLYNMISICSNVVVLPAENNNSNLVFGAQMPLDEITKSDKNGNKVDLDIFIAIFNLNNDVVFNLQRQIKMDIKKEAPKEKKKSLGLYCSASIAAGDYRVRFFIRNRNNMLISSEEYKITVPDFRNSSLIIGSPLLYKNIQDVLTVNLDKAGVDDKNSERKTVLSSLPGVYSISNEVKNNRKIKICVEIKGLTVEEIMAHRDGLISWQAVKPIPAGFAEEPPVDLQYKVDDIIEINNGIFLTLFELDISDVPKGDFLAVIRTAKDGLTASSSIKLHVI
jgi:VWFA-related protein